MTIDFNRQLFLINKTGKTDIADLTRALEGKERSGLRGLVKRVAAAIAGRYDLARFEKSIDGFFAGKKVEITSLKTSNPEEYAKLRDLLQQRAFSLTEAKGDDSGTYNRLMNRISAHMPE